MPLFSAHERQLNPLANRFFFPQTRLQHTKDWTLCTFCALKYNQVCAGLHFAGRKEKSSGTFQSGIIQADAFIQNSFCAIFGRENWWVISTFLNFSRNSNAFIIRWNLIFRKVRSNLMIDWVVISILDMKRVFMCHQLNDEEKFPNFLVWKWRDRKCQSKIADLRFHS